MVFLSHSGTEIPPINSNICILTRQLFSVMVPHDPYRTDLLQDTRPHLTSTVRDPLRKPNIKPKGIINIPHMLDKYLKRIKKKIPTLTRPVRGYFKNRQVLAEIRKCTGQPIKKVDGKLYVIGDSHSNFFSGEEEIVSVRFRKGIYTGNHLISFFRIFHIGPALAFNLSRMNTTSQAREKILYLVEHAIPPGAAILLCFGEIDCRVHILRQAEKKELTTEEVIDNILDNYITLINDLQLKGFHPICWGPIASQKECWNQNAEFPRYGTEAERNKITEIFNNKLEERCRNIHVTFCSIFRRLVSPDYLTDEYYISDHCPLR